MSFSSSCSTRLTRMFVPLFSLLMIVDIAQAAPNQWSSVGPQSEPAVHSLLVDPNAKTTIYAGAIGEVWKTIDGGRNWTGADTPGTASCEVRALAMDPSNSSTLYAGCIGTIKSTDAGLTWTSITTGMEDRGAIPAVWAIAIDPSDPATLYAGTPFGTVFKSIDSGAHWQLTGTLPNAAREIRALAIDPMSPMTVYAGATNGGVFKTLDGGVSWTSANTGLSGSRVTSLAIDSRSPATLYAGTIDQGVFKTLDGASSWTAVFGPQDAGGVTFTVSELAIDPFAPSTLYITMGNTDLGVFQTTDAGATWNRISTGLPFFAMIRALAIAPSAPSTIYIGSLDQYPGLVDGGVFEMSVASRCPQGSSEPGITEFAIPTENSQPLGIAEGPDCALWFTETRGNKIGRIAVTGEITEFPIPTAASNSSRIAAGPDGALWFTESDGNKIGRITTAGVITEFPIATPRTFPVGITAGPDGNLWFAQQSGHSIGRITPAGVITEFLVPPLGPFPALPLGIAVGGDGNLWFTEYFTGRVGRITTSGVVTLFRVEPVESATLGEIARGSDGNMWFTEQWENRIVRITTAGSMEYFPLASPGQGLGADDTAYGIAAGPDGALWYAHTGGVIGRITTAGVISEFQVPTAGASPNIITAGPDSAMWFTEYRGNKIGRITVTAVDPPRRDRRRSVRR